jgi:hypothetical protein
MLRFVPIGIGLFAITNFVFHWFYNEDALVPGVVGMALAALFLFVPWRRMQKLRRLTNKFTVIDFNDESDAEKLKTYEHYCADFVEDYDRENPVTSA